MPATSNSSVRKEEHLNASSMTTLLIILFMTVGLSRPVAAYIDLGTGSYLLQLFLAGLFGVLFSAKTLWAKLRGSRQKPSDNKSLR